jgi:hypothetical protein
LDKNEMLRIESFFFFFMFNLFHMSVEVG